MQLRSIGRTDVRISPLVLGCNVFGWTVDQRASFEILDAYVDAGFNAIDTADVYSAWVSGNSGGESEAIIGEWLSSRGKRDSIVIATKVGAQTPDWQRCCLSAKHIERAVEDSLRRLQTDYIDLYQAHQVDPGTPLEESMEAFERLVQAGKVRVIGSSHYPSSVLTEAERLCEAQSLSRFECVQQRYNLLDRHEFEVDLQSYCLENEVGVLGYSALAKGYLSGKYVGEGALPSSQWAKQINHYHDERGSRVLGEVLKISKAIGAPPASISLAWAIAQKGITGAVCAVNSLEELHELRLASDISLDAEQMSRLSEASA